MTARLNVALSDDLNREIDLVANDSQATKAEIFRKALQLYLAARKGQKEGYKLGLVDPKTDQLRTEIIGL